MNKFVNKAAVERKLNEESIRSDDKERLSVNGSRAGGRKSVEEADGDGDVASLQNSGYWQNLEVSHETEEDSVNKAGLGPIAGNKK